MAEDLRRRQPRWTKNEYQSPVVKFEVRLRCHKSYSPYFTTNCISIHVRLIIRFGIGIDTNGSCATWSRLVREVCITVLLHQLLWGEGMVPILNWSDSFSSAARSHPLMAAKQTPRRSNKRQLSHRLIYYACMFPPCFMPHRFLVWLKKLFWFLAADKDPSSTWGMR